MTGPDWLREPTSAEFRAITADASRNGTAPALKTRGVDLDRVTPVRWAWNRRIIIGMLTLLVGNEGIGKGLLTAWIVARATRGELEGDLHGAPTTVLVVGDEDDFDSIWVPRLYAAGADLSRIRTLDDGEHLDNIGARAGELIEAIHHDAAGFVLFDGLMDHISGGKDGGGINNPKHVRDALRPLRRVLKECDIPGVGVLHPNKGRAQNFRDLTAGSHQFNAVARSGLLLTEDPEDRDRRILVRGKGNHSAEPQSFEFGIGIREFQLGEHSFETPLVDDIEEGDRTVNDLLGRDAVSSGGRPATVAADLAPRIYSALIVGSMNQSELARELNANRDTVRRVLRDLEDEGRIEKKGAAYHVPKG